MLISINRFSGLNPEVAVRQDALVLSCPYLLISALNLETNMKKTSGALAVVVLSFILLIAGARVGEAATNCTATLTGSSTDLTLAVPALSFYGSLYSASLKYHTSTDSHVWFYVLSTAGATQDCTNPATLSLNAASAYILHVPVLTYQGISYTVDLQYVPYTDGLIWFKIISVAQN